MSELQATWRKSSYSGDEGGECVEVAATIRQLRIRDSKNATGPQLAFPTGAWAEFLGEARQG